MAQKNKIQSKNGSGLAKVVERGPDTWAWRRIELEKARSFQEYTSRFFRSKADNNRRYPCAQLFFRKLPAIVASEPLTRISHEREATSADPPSFLGRVRASVLDGPRAHAHAALGRAPKSHGCFGSFAAKHRVKSGPCLKQFGRIRWFALSVLVFVLMASHSVSANEKGTWFIGEMHHGVGFPAGFMQDGIGYSARGVFGVGGRISGTFLLCHALFSLGYGGFLETTATPIDSGQLERSIIDVGGGFRLSIPIVGRVRVYTDILAGYGHILTDLSLGPYERYDMSYGGFALTVGGGLQYRLARFMSIGVRGEWTGVLRNELVDFATAVLARPQSDSAFHGRHAYFVSATFHF